VLRKNLKPILLVLICLVLASLFLMTFYVMPRAGIGPAQPISFSHRLHAGVKRIDCRFCHPYVDRSAFPGIAPVEKCLFCHKHIIAKHPEILKEHRYFNSNTSTPWRKTTFVPEHVLFNHQRHIRKQIQCEQCHGEIRKMDRIPKNRFKMSFCIECHREKKANLDCWLACHS